MKEKLPVHKNEEYIVDIIDNGIDGEGIAKIEGFTVFIDGALKGEKCKILILKVVKSHAFGKILEIINKSDKRIDPDCSTYKRCGGCSLRHIEYEETLNIKQNIVQNLFNKSSLNYVKVRKTLGMGVPYNYRNKAVYPIGINKKKEPVVGIYAKRTHEIIQMRDCLIHDNITEQIAFALYKFIKENNISIYDENKRNGLFRHVIIKVGIRTHEIMCIFVINGKEIPKQKQLINMLTQRFPEIKTIIKNINKKNTNVIMGIHDEVIYGDGYIYDILGEYTFKISPHSFYQVNSVQAEALYNIALEMANLKKDDILYDLYCGIGTIGIFASKYVKKVYGIEVVSQAIIDAKENAKLNNINNITFIEGKAEETFEKVIKKYGDYPDIVIIDPPRKGIDINIINTILSVESKKIIYVSYNPATKVRDMKLLEDKYDVKEVQPVDMFPFTSHVECVVAMTLRETL